MSQFSVDFEIDPIPHRGSWVKNCAYKPTFLLQKLEKHHRPLVWIDVDARLLNPPTLFNSITADIAFKFNETLPFDHPSKILTGTLYVKPTNEAKKLLTHWESLCKAGPKVWDQIHLKKGLETFPKTQVFPLPEAYCAIFDQTRLPEDQIVILHTQASRKLKKIVDNEVLPFFS